MAAIRYSFYMSGFQIISQKDRGWCYKSIAKRTIPLKADVGCDVSGSVFGGKLSVEDISPSQQAPLVIDMCVRAIEARAKQTGKFNNHFNHINLFDYVRQGFTFLYKCKGD